jgi:hypothetical protein
MPTWIKVNLRWIAAAVLCGPPVAFAIVILMMPRLLVVDFLGDVHEGRAEQAYRRTSKAFQSYISKDDFPAYIRATREWTDSEVTLTRGALRMGKDCCERKRLVLEIGACCEGEQISRLIFVWEDGGWRFDCVSTP